MDTSREVGSEPAAQDRPRAATFVPVPGAKSSSLYLRLALLVAGSVLPVLLLTGFVVYDSYVRAREAAADRVLQTARSAMAAVDRELQNQISALQVLALEPDLVNGDFEAFRDDADRFRQVNPASVISVSTPDGAQVFNSVVRTNIPPRVNQDALRQVFKTGQPVISDMYIGKVSGRVTFAVEVPVRRDGQVLYSMAYSPPRQTYFEILRRLSLPDGWVVSLFDRNAHHVARHPAITRERLTSAGDMLKAELVKRDQGIVPTASIEGTPILTAFTRSLESGWVVAIGMPYETLDRPARQSLVLAAAIGTALLLLGFLFASRLAGQLVRAEAHRSLLMNELNHRVKNTLTSVQSIVARGLPDLPANAAYKRAAESRLLALSSAHNILSTQNWESASVSDLAKAVVGPYGPKDRVRLEGPEVILAPRLAIPFAMILNELATNAVKHGALSAPGGAVSVAWSMIGPDRLRLEWRELGGPPTLPPTVLGYGTRFIERAVSHELGGAYASAYPAEGFTCTIEIPV